MYDSKEDTLTHISRVRLLLYYCVEKITARGAYHDQSKLEQPEKTIFDEYTPKLATSTYGGDEYKGFLAEMKVALDHHYAANRHHPEHHTDAIDGMNLIDLIEMLCDWKAATERHNNGDIRKSLEINKERFGISDQLLSILKNTVDELKW